MTRFAYDAANRLESRTDGFGTPDAAATDASSTTASATSSRSATPGRRSWASPGRSKRTYDDLNRLETETDGEGNVTTYGYDAEGNRTSASRRRRARPPAFEYDELGKLTKVTQPSPAAGQPQPVTRVRLRREPQPRAPDGRERPRRRDGVRRAQPPEEDDPGSGRPRPRHRDDPLRRERQPGGRASTPRARRSRSTFDELNRLKTKSLRLRAGRRRPALALHRRRSTTATTRTATSRRPTSTSRAARARPTRPSSRPAPTTASTASTSETQALPDGGSRTVSLQLLQERHPQDRHRPRRPRHPLRLRRPEPPRRTRRPTSAPPTPRPRRTPTGPTTSSTRSPTRTASWRPTATTRPIASCRSPTRRTPPPSRPTSTRASTRPRLPVSYDANGNRLIQVEMNGGTTETTDLRLRRPRPPGVGHLPGGRGLSPGPSGKLRLRRGRQPDPRDGEGLGRRRACGQAGRL